MYFKALFVSVILLMSFPVFATNPLMPCEDDLLDSVPSAVNGFEVEDLSQDERWKVLYYPLCLWGTQAGCSEIESHVDTLLSPCRVLGHNWIYYLSLCWFGKSLLDVIGRSIPSQEELSGMSLPRYMISRFTFAIGNPKARLYKLGPLLFTAVFWVGLLPDFIEPMSFLRGSSLKHLCAAVSLNCLFFGLHGFSTSVPMPRKAKRS